jgi:hypothetical protein
MEDPVIAPDGNTYERTYIEEWIRTNQSSPITKEPMDPSQRLHPNFALKFLIELSKQSQTKAQQDLSKGNFSFHKKVIYITPLH